MRRGVDISIEVSIVRDIQEQELRIYTDAGRCSRPLLIVNNQKIEMKRSDIRKLQRKDVTGFGWSELVASGLVEFIGKFLNSILTSNRILIRRF